VTYISIWGFSDFAEEEGILIKSCLSKFSAVLISIKLLLLKVCIEGHEGSRAEQTVKFANMLVHLWGRIQ
jgi:hypothetical protein